MRILNQNNIEITDADIDYSLGYVAPESFFIAHHDAVEAVEKQSHYEVIAEYPNGGRDVVEVIDVEPVEEKEAWDEYEDILRYTLFTESELAANEIADLKEKLDATDYVVIKMMEGAATEIEYMDVLADRQNWRARINELEKLL